MKNLLKRFKKIISCGLLSTVMFSNIVTNAPQLLTDNVTHTKSVLSTFYTEPKDSADVVFIGSSALYRFISPVQIYYKHGITALNYSAAALDIHTTEGLIDEIIEHQHPKLIVVEMRNYVNNCDNYLEGIGFTKKNLAAKERFFKDLVYNMPNSKNRAKVINDVVGTVLKKDPVEWQHKNLYSNYKDLSVFETAQWQTKYENYVEKLPIKYKTKKGTYNGEKYKGTVASTGIMSIKKNDFSKYTKKKKITGEWLDVLNGIIEKAKSCGTKVMFMSSPYSVDKKSVAYENATGSIIKANGLKYLNCNKYYKKIGLDFKRDFYDDKHANISGMVKVTNYVAKYIVKNYKLGKTKLSKAEKKSWQTATNLWIKNVRTPGLAKVKKFKA